MKRPFLAHFLKESLYVCVCKAIVWAHDPITVCYISEAYFIGANLGVRLYWEHTYFWWFDLLARGIHGQHMKVIVGHHFWWIWDTFWTFEAIFDNLSSFMAYIKSIFRDLNAIILHLFSFWFLFAWSCVFLVNQRPILSNFSTLILILAYFCSFRASNRAKMDHYMYEKWPFSVDFALFWPLFLDHFQPLIYIIYLYANLYMIYNIY